jgi:hypothetical protein
MHPFISFGEGLEDGRLRLLWGDGDRALYRRQPTGGEPYIRHQSVLHDLWRTCSRPDTG